MVAPSNIVVQHCLNERNVAFSNYNIPMKLNSYIKMNHQLLHKEITKRRQPYVVVYGHQLTWYGYFGGNIYQKRLAIFRCVWLNGMHGTSDSIPFVNSCVRQPAFSSFCPFSSLCAFLAPWYNVWIQAFLGMVTFHWIPNVSQCDMKQNCLTEIGAWITNCMNKSYMRLIYSSQPFRNFCQSVAEVKARMNNYIALCCVVVIIFRYLSWFLPESGTK